MKKVLYSIGHGNRSPFDLLLIFNQYGIKRLIDVRSVPFSQYARSYDRNVLRGTLPKVNIEYIYMGDALGERPSKDDSLYTQGVADYEKMAATLAYQNALVRLLNYADGNTVVFCTEMDPIKCHRFLSIGRTATSKGIEMRHIVGRENPFWRGQSELEEELVSVFYPDPWQLSFFEEPLSMRQMIDNSYRYMNRRVGWPLNLNIDYSMDKIVFHATEEYPFDNIN